MNPRDLLKTARELANSGKGKPRQSNLLRAVSTTYYAMFHTLAKCCANGLIGGPGAAKHARAWQLAYRAINHKSAHDNCKKKDKLEALPVQIIDFADKFIEMQEKRHKADYDPTERAYKSAVTLDIDLVETAIDAFEATPMKDRRAFAAHLLWKER